MSGKKNSFTAILYHESEGEKKPLYTAEGQWSNTFVIKTAKGKKQEIIENYCARTEKTTPLTLAPLEEQDLYESRRAWKDVAAAIGRGDMDATSVAKSKIEVAQRQLRKLEREEGREWERRFFKRVESGEDDQVFLKLAEKLGWVDSNGNGGLESDKTGGVWRFLPEAAKNAVPPYHKDGARGLGLVAGDNSSVVVEQATESTEVAESS